MTQTRFLIWIYKVLKSFSFWISSFIDILNHQMASIHYPTTVSDSFRFVNLIPYIIKWNQSTAYYPATVNDSDLLIWFKKLILRIRNFRERKGKFTWKCFCYLTLTRSLNWNQPSKIKNSDLKLDWQRDHRSHSHLITHSNKIISTWWFDFIVHTI